MNKDFVKIIDLGEHPFADTFIGENEIDLKEPIYPLQCYLNRKSGEIKLGIITKAEDRYNLVDYSYTSSNSKFSRDHWIKYADEVLEKVNPEKYSISKKYLSNNDYKILEIGSNDGFLAKQFKNRGFNVLGCDPSYSMEKLASKRGIKTHTYLFSYKTSKDIMSSYDFHADLVVANNVFNHSNNPIDFVKGVTNILNYDGTFIYELPYWYNTIKSKKFDQIYHEHVTYFTVKYSYDLLLKMGLHIYDVDVVDYHGGSLRVYARKVPDRNSIKKSTVVKRMIEEENNFGLFDAKTYKIFMKEITDKKNDFIKKIHKIKSNGKSIIGVGAAAKGNTFLNFYNLDNTIIDFITDSSEYKKKKYTPATRIPIVGDEIFAEYDEVYALILSWNISNLIKENLKNINDKIEFLSLPA